MTRLNHKEEIREMRTLENADRLNHGGFEMALKFEIRCSDTVKEVISYENYDESVLGDPVHFDRIRIYEGTELIAEGIPEMHRTCSRLDDGTLSVMSVYECTMETDIMLTGVYCRGLFRDKVAFDRSCKRKYRIVFCYDNYEVCERDLRFVPDMDSMLGYDRICTSFPGRSAEKLIGPYLKKK